MAARGVDLSGILGSLNQLGQSNALYSQRVMQKRAEEEAERARRIQMMAMIGGGIAGAAMAPAGMGAAGAIQGAQLGSAAGNLAGSMATGRGADPNAALNLAAGAYQVNQQQEQMEANKSINQQQIENERKLYQNQYGDAINQYNQNKIDLGPGGSRTAEGANNPDLKQLELQTVTNDGKKPVPLNPDEQTAIMYVENLDRLLNDPKLAQMQPNQVQELIQQGRPQVREGQDKKFAVTLNTGKVMFMTPQQLNSLDGSQVRKVTTIDKFEQTDETTDPKDNNRFLNTGSKYGMKVPRRILALDPELNIPNFETSQKYDSAQRDAVSRWIIANKDKFEGTTYSQINEKLGKTVNEEATQYARMVTKDPNYPAIYYSSEDLNSEARKELFGNLQDKNFVQVEHDIQKGGADIDDLYKTAAQIRDVDQRIAAYDLIRGYVAKSSPTGKDNLANARAEDFKKPALAEVIGNIRLNNSGGTNLIAELWAAREGQEYTANNGDKYTLEEIDYAATNIAHQKVSLELRNSRLKPSEVDNLKEIQRNLEEEMKENIDKVYNRRREMQIIAQGKTDDTPGVFRIQNLKRGDFDKMINHIQVVSKQQPPQFIEEHIQKLVDERTDTVIAAIEANAPDSFEPENAEMIFKHIADKDKSVVSDIPSLDYRRIQERLNAGIAGQKRDSPAKPASLSTGEITKNQPVNLTQLAGKEIQRGYEEELKQYEKALLSNLTQLETVLNKNPNADVSAIRDRIEGIRNKISSREQEGVIKVKPPKKAQQEIERIKGRIQRAEKRLKHVRKEFPDRPTDPIERAIQSHNEQLDLYKILFDID